MVQKLVQAWKRFKNERLYRRVVVEIPVRLTPNGAEPVDLKITNWSAGGVFIRTETHYPIYSIADLDFALGSKGDSKLKLKGQIVRQEPSGVGIMFTDFTESALLILRDFLAKESTKIS